MPQIWIPQYDETLKWLRDHGYHGYGGVYAIEENAVAKGKELRKQGFQVKMMTRKGKYGNHYTLWVKK